MSEVEYLKGSIRKLVNQSYVGNTTALIVMSELQTELIQEGLNYYHKQSSQALCRTSMYELDSAINKFKLAAKKANKPSTIRHHLFKLVNLLCIGNTSIKQVECNTSTDQEALACIIPHKQIIIDNNDWYERVIPESKWLIEYLLTLE